MTNAPVSCCAPRCGYLIQLTSHDRCAHNIEFPSPCARHRTPAQIRAMHERDLAMLEAARAPMAKRRGL